MEKAYLTVKDIQERYDYGINKARGICEIFANPVTEESLVDKQYKERL